MRLKEEGHRQALHLRECEETIIGMEQTIQMNTKYSKEEIEKLRKVRDELHNKQLTLDDELTNLKKSDENIQKNRNNHTEVIEAKISSLQKDYETALQKIRREASDDLSEDNSKKDQEQLGAISEKKKVEKLRPVRFSQIEGPVGDLNRRLFVRRIHIDDAFEHLIANEDRDMGQNDIMLSTLEVNLRKEPFMLGKEEAKLVSRYLVEDNFEETVEYDSKRMQSKVTARSIFKTMIGPLEILPLDTLRKMFKIIDEKVKEKKAIISSKLQDKEKKETVPIAKFVEEIKAPTSGLADMDELVKKLMIDTMIERAEGNKEIRIASLYENFTEAQFDEFFVNMAAKSPSRKLAHKKTVVSNMSRPMSKRGSQSDQGDDHKKIDLKNLPNEDNSKSRTFNELSDRDSAIKHNLRTKSNIPIKEANIEFSNSDESRDISRESDDGPPPQMFVKQVDTFNDPKTKEMILSLEQIKAAGQVKNAIGMMMFGKKPTQTGVDTGKADQKQTASPFSFGLIKKATSQESVKVNPFSSLAKDRGAIIENVKPATDSHAHLPVQSAIDKPTAQTVDIGKHEDVKQSQISKQPLMLSVDGDDDDDDEDDEIDRMLQDNKDFDEY